MLALTLTVSFIGMKTKTNKTIIVPKIEHHNCETIVAPHIVGQKFQSVELVKGTKTYKLWTESGLSLSFYHTTSCCEIYIPEEIVYINGKREDMFGLKIETIGVHKVWPHKAPIDFKRRPSTGRTRFFVVVEIELEGGKSVCMYYSFHMYECGNSHIEMNVTHHVESSSRRLFKLNAHMDTFIPTFKEMI